MKTLTTTTHVGPHGDVVLTLPSVPELANVDVDVLVVLSPVARNGEHPASPAGNGSAPDAAWQEHIDRFAGSLPDFPDVDRPGPDSYETRLPLD